MEQQTATLKLPCTLLSDAPDVALTQNVSIGELVRGLLQNEVARRQQGRHRTQVQSQKWLQLRAMLATELELADGWNDLLVRLCDHSYELRSCGNEVAISCRMSGTRVFKTGDLGFSYAQLVGRFECAMPGHPFGTSIQAGSLPPPVQRSLPLAGGASFEVIDRDA